jgi:uncharacterized protein (DUF58 family)
VTIRPLVPPPASGAARPGRRFAAAFGPRFFLLLGAGLVLIVPAFLDPRALWGLAAWNLGVVTLWILDLRRIEADGQIAVSRTWSAPLALRTPASVTVQVENRSPLPLQIEATDDVPATFREDLPARTIDVPAGASAKAEYEIQPSARGDIHIGELALRVRSPWAIAERWLTAPTAQTVRVYPDIDRARRQTMYLLRSRQVALEKRRVRIPAIGRDFESLRDYQPGDDPRDVCWTVTARRGHPVTKVYQPERSQAVWILVDGGRLLRARIGDRTKLDAMVDAALALAEVALASGDRVGLVTYGRQVHQRIAPARGPQHLRVLLEALASVTAERVEGDHTAAAAAVTSVQKQRALIVWLTDLAETAATPDVVEHAAGLSVRHVVLFTLTREPEMAALAAAPPADEAALFRMVAVQEMLDRRETLLRGLRQRGVLVLEMPPAAPAALLVDQYLSVKDRNLI